MQPTKIHDVVADEFSQVNDYILSQLKSEIPLIEQIGYYIISNGGKRMRPLMVLLAARAAQPAQGLSETQLSHTVKMASIIEFIHTATLLHDDVVDESDMRRGKKTANEEWGNAPSVLVGDFLYSRAFQIMVNVGSVPCMEILSNTTNIISEGEVQQLINCGDPDTSEESYLKVIQYKTAKLFEGAALCGAVVAGASEEHQKALQAYGMYVGTAFQLVDDVMDYVSTAEEMGKSVGDDLAEGKPTLPLIYTMKHGDADAKERVRQAILTGGLENLEQILSDVRACGAIEYTEKQAEEQADLAIKAIQAFPESEHKSALIALANAAVKRRN
ncbi:octaprenyl diphosphate synthase [Marinomonas mediterranea]|jgi:Geranylgeranyl pyrophosphate synthase|uniref:Octaprenyl diphosphate synthase n=1 Tax=Marinomonas mediterranea (strain ATCC 700492 / JCM 21426 / NBRC 103028 / MMB-1) TaxID=717774 RepID=F2JXU2_MARM1|nr:octaprenyl diphosphate synthase [Marinomonas mediterranea]ADZ89591.1 Trans-hexaprenyltranstransferase [Marinomonas mediterranea MMB-1]WCN07683.1 octaprenyl diphosphate synthase [Marinomonas mediterranea]WCN11785.1 octaprenyl diphosphate synthase [Marinomonas mediterranea]WCN15833.1 octaprenyl diphosphate synthase [Marinomonas mediterranea MMB-1]